MAPAYRSDGSTLTQFQQFNIRARISVGDNSLIASGSRFIDHDHALSLKALILEQAGPEAPSEIGSDC
jgi:hypothetical protein